MTNFKPGDRVSCRMKNLYPGTIALIDATGMLFIYGDNGLKFWGWPRLFITD